MNDNFGKIKNEYSKFSASGSDGRYCKDWWKNGLLYLIDCKAKASLEKKRKALENKNELVKKELELKIKEQQDMRNERIKNNTIVVAVSSSLLLTGAVIYFISTRQQPVIK
jgi:hypothetical protein